MKNLENKKTDAGRVQMYVALQIAAALSSMRTVLAFYIR
jgi:hypothetical protein